MQMCCKEGLYEVITFHFSGTTLKMCVATCDHLFYIGAADYHSLGKHAWTSAILL